MSRVLKVLCVTAALLFSLSAPAAVVVSSKLSSESAMLGQMIRLVLNANGMPTLDRTRIGATPVVRKALLTGEIDLYVEYTGNAGAFFNDAANPAWKDLQKGYAAGRQARLRGQPHRVAHPGPGEQFLGPRGSPRPC